MFDGRRGPDGCGWAVNSDAERLLIKTGGDGTERCEVACAWTHLPLQMTFQAVMTGHIGSSSAQLRTNTASGSCTANPHGPLGQEPYRF